MPYKDKEKQREKNREYQKKHYQNNKEYYITKSRESKSKAREEFKEFKKICFVRFVAKIIQRLWTFIIKIQMKKK